uniref:Uncharacterized protein n=1 Tax=Physcomitrium patens TaxID=3218 RepID=A0A2K1IJC9_PHYPA|nr:hypothetical protein PHYPA_028073 [Physcomitrium patens]
MVNGGFWIDHSHRGLQETKSPTGRNSVHHAHLSLQNRVIEDAPSEHISQLETRKMKSTIFPVPLVTDNSGNAAGSHLAFVQLVFVS